MRSRYSAVAIMLHWAIAALILSNLYVGWRLHLLGGLAQFNAFQLHKSIGITVLVLSLARLAWRMGHRPPALPEGMNCSERRAALATHWFFYGVMIGMPLTGWAVVSVSPYNLPTLLWHTIPWPHISFLHDLPTNSRKRVEVASGAIHYLLAIGGSALIILHVCAALKHHLFERDDVLRSMLPLIPFRRK